MSVILGSCAYWAPARFVMVGDDAKPEVITFRCRFKRLKRAESRELNERIAATGDVIRHERGLATLSAEELEKRKQRYITDKEVLDILLVDWDLKTKTGDVVLYSEQVRAEIVEEWDGFEQAMVTSYFNANTEAAKAEAAAKNSEAPSSTGS